MKETLPPSSTLLPSSPSHPLFLLPPRTLSSYSPPHLPPSLPISSSPLPPSTLSSYSPSPLTSHPPILASSSPSPTTTITQGEYDIVTNDYERAKSLFDGTQVKVFKKGKRTAHLVTCHLPACSCRISC